MALYVKAVVVQHHNSSSRDYIASSFQSYERTTLLKPLSSALFLKAASLMTIYHEI